MQPHKTDKAHDALRNRPTDVSVLERRLLILSDGRRHQDELVALLGRQAYMALARLLHDGYLVDGHAPNVSTAPTIPAPPSPPMPAAPSRRSVAAARMYLVDMLQLQRSEDASAIATAVRACRDPDELVAQLLRGLRCIHAVANASLGRRVAERLAEILPEQYLPELEVFRDTLFADQADAA